MKHIPMVSLRLVRERSIPYSTRLIQGSREVYEVFRGMAEDLDREALWVMCLDAKHRVICLSQVSLGTISGAPAHPGEILKIALMANAKAIILVHNHPSGDPEPSLDDRTATMAVQEAARMVGVRLLDHLIVGDGSYHSFKDRGSL